MILLEKQSIFFKGQLKKNKRDKKKLPKLACIHYFNMLSQNNFKCLESYSCAPTGLMSEHLRCCFGLPALELDLAISISAL